VRTHRPLLAAPHARLLAYALLAGVGALQWSRYVEEASRLRPLLWVAAGVAGGALVLAADRLPLRIAAFGTALAALAGLVLSVAISGVELHFLAPDHWDELGDGLMRGAEALNTVRLPYAGEDPWVPTTVQLSGAVLCWAAAMGAAWPQAAAGTRVLSLVLLLVLAASPVISLGVENTVPLGLALAVLTAAFLWLERLSTRPGLGLAVLAAAAGLVAVPLGAAADREEPWFDYRAFSENFSGGTPISFNWNHGYGPIDWAREGAELFRVRSDRPYYWKADQLNTFDGRAWTTSARTDPGGDEPEDDLPLGWEEHDGWNARLQVSLRRLRTPTVVGAGTILGVEGPTRPVEPDAVPGRWIVSAGRELRSGDSYTVQAHVPRPSPEQLAAATVGADVRRYGSLTLHLDYRPDAAHRAPLTPPFPGRARRPMLEADVQFPPFERREEPVARYRLTGEERSGEVALDSSYYDRTWSLAKRLRERSISPYDYVLRVNALLREDRFEYTEVPPPSGGEAPLEHFLFESRLGYCQQYSGAMVLLLRMGGIPSRVATGFSPGGFRRSSGEWIVRDTDAHSWVEAWFDGLGWVTFDPTPPQTPARSQVAAIDPAPDAAESPAPPASTAEDPTARRPEGPTRETPVESAETASGGGPPWALFGGLAALAVLAGVVTRRLRRRAAAEADPVLAELERALRRSGRHTPAGTTLAQLERRLGASGEGAGYLRAVRAAM
jgi:transglutaminase-like putative cysteine protease